MVGEAVSTLILHTSPFPAPRSLWVFAWIIAINWCPCLILSLFTCVVPPQYKNEVAGRAKLGVAAFADALLFIPKTLAANSGLDAQDALIALLEEGMKGHKVGLDVETGKCLLPAECGIWDNHRVKRQFLTLGSIIACKLLLVDEVMRAGRNIKTGPNGE